MGLTHYGSMISWMKWPTPSICGDQNPGKTVTDREGVDCEECLRILGNADRAVAEQNKGD